MKHISDINQLDLNKKYTYRDYLTWRFKEKVELIMGKIFKMTPAPSTTHQQVLWRITKALGKVEELEKCDVFVAPFDVRLFPDGHTVVQPDICIVCDSAKLDEKGCMGPPDLIIEILSPSTAAKDLNEKYDIYERAGVKEYWTVDAADGIINVFLLVNGRYVPQRPHTYSQEIGSSVIQGLVIDLKEVFPDHLEEPVDPYEGKRI